VALGPVSTHLHARWPGGWAVPANLAARPGTARGGAGAQCAAQYVINTMPQHKSAAKRVRQSEKRRDQNRGHKSRVRTMIKELRAVTTRSEAEPKLNAVKALLDRMATRRQAEPNAVARAKSQLERFVNALD